MNIQNNNTTYPFFIVPKLTDGKKVKLSGIALYDIIHKLPWVTTLPKFKDVKYTQIIVNGVMYITQYDIYIIDVKYEKAYLVKNITFTYSTYPMKIHTIEGNQYYMLMSDHTVYKFNTYMRSATKLHFYEYVNCIDKNGYADEMRVNINIKVTDLCASRHGLCLVENNKIYLSNDNGCIEYSYSYSSNILDIQCAFEWPTASIVLVLEKDKPKMLTVEGPNISHHAPESVADDTLYVIRSGISAYIVNRQIYLFPNSFDLESYDKYITLLFVSMLMIQNNQMHTLSSDEREKVFTLANLRICKYGDNIAMQFIPKYDHDSDLGKLCLNNKMTMDISIACIDE